MADQSLAQVQPMPPAKRQRRSDYEEMRDLTEAYIRKVRKTLETCTHAGTLQSSLQRYFSSEQFTRNHSDAMSRTSVLAFIMHAAEVAQRQPLSPPQPMVVETPIRIEVGSQTAKEENEGKEATLQTAEMKIEETAPLKLPEELPKVVKEPPKEAPAAPPFSSLPREAPKEPVPTDKPSEPKPKPLFRTIVGRSTNKDAAKPPRNKVPKPPAPPSGKGKLNSTVTTVQPPASLPVSQMHYQPASEYACDLCRERFWTENDLQNHHSVKHMAAEPPSGGEGNNYESANVPCPIDGCGEQFEDNYELLLHMRTFHAS